MGSDPDIWGSKTMLDVGLSHDTKVGHYFHRRRKRLRHSFAYHFVSVFPMVLGLF